MNNNIEAYKKDSLVNDVLLDSNLTKIRNKSAWKHVFDKENYSVSAIDKLFKALKIKKRVLENTFKNDSDSYSYFRNMLENQEKECFNFVFEETDRIKGIPSNYKMYDNIAIECLKDNDLIIEWISDDLKNNKKEMLKFLSWNPLKYNFVKEVSPINQDIDICRMVLKEVPSYLKVMPDIIKKNKELTTLAIKNQVVMYNNIDESLTNDYEYILNLIKIEDSGILYEFINNDFKKDRLIIEAAIENFCYAYLSLDDNFKLEKKNILLYLKNGGLLKNVPDIMFKQDDIVIEMLDVLGDKDVVIDNLDMNKLLINKLFKDGVGDIDGEIEIGNKELLKDIVEKGTIYLKREYISQDIEKTNKKSKRLKF